MSNRLEPSIRATFKHKLFPESEGTVTRRYSTRGLADAGAWAEGKVARFGRVSRRMTRPDGSYESDSARIELVDEDLTFRGYMADAAKRYIAGVSELVVEILSEAGRIAGGTWRPLIRGPVSDIQCPSNLRAVLEVTDALGGQVTGYNLDKTLGVKMTRAVIPGLPKETIGRIFPIITGEWSDIGSVDANGEPNDKGKLPPVDAGWVLLGADGSFAPDDATIGRLPAPTGLAADVDTPGTRTRRYGVTAYSAVGETTLSTELVVTIPDDMSDGVPLSWNPVSGATGYGVYSGGRRIKNVTGSTAWTDDGSLSATGPAAPETNGALIETEVNGVTYGVWRMFVRKIGAGPDVFHVYGSDLAEGQAPKRIRLPESVYGPEVLVYGRAGWPHANSYIEMNGVRFAPMYATGPRLQHHLNGTVTFAWNGCGDPGDDGDDDKPTITEAFPAWQHVLNTYGFMNNGAGYSSGAWGVLAEFLDGVPIIKTSEVENCQARTVGWVGGRGYPANISIFTPITLREFDKRFRQTFTSETCSDHFGQLYPCFVESSGVDGRLYHWQFNMGRMLESQSFKHSEAVTRQIFHCDWDEDGQQFIRTDVEIHNTLMTAAYGGVPREKSPRSCYYCADFATVWDAQSRYVARYCVAPREIEIKTDLTGLEDELAAEVRITSPDGAGGTAGDVETRFMVIGHEVETSEPGAESTTLLLFDLERMIVRTLPLAGDKADADIILGDKDSTEAPPEGAYLAG